MKKNILFLIFAFLIILTVNSDDKSYSHRIFLSDGSVINATLIKFENNIYLFNSPLLGNIRLQEENILKLEKVNISKSPVNTNIQKTIPQIPSTKKLPDMSAIQNKIMSNMNMADLEKLMSNESIMQLMSNPEIMELILKGDYESLMKNDEILKLMNDPDIKNILNLFQR